MCQGLQYRTSRALRVPETKSAMAQLQRERKARCSSFVLCFLFCVVFDVFSFFVNLIFRFSFSLTLFLTFSFVI